MQNKTIQHFFDNEKGFTLIEMLLVLFITLTLVAAISKVGYRVYEEQKLEYFVDYFEFILREAQVYAIEHEVTSYIRKKNNKLEIGFMHPETTRYEFLWEVSIPNYIDRFNIYKNQQTIYTIYITNYGQISGIYVVLFEKNNKRITLNIGIGKGRITRS